MPRAEKLHDHQTSSRMPVAMSILAFVVLLAALLRLMGVGARSLWLDEFCTWHVSRMDLRESLRWAPELTIPPLYQFAIRLIDHSAHPPEWLLRLPAVVAGALVVPAAYWFGAVIAHRRVGLALAILVAFNVLQIEYSREARPYSMLVLGCTLSFTLWFRIITQKRRRDVFIYVLVTSFSFYAHVLTSLTLAAQLIWWIGVARRRPGKTPWRRPLAALVITAVLCVPLLARAILYRGSIGKAIEWIDPPTWQRMAGMVGDLTFGGFYIVVVLVLVFAVLLQHRRILPSKAVPIAETEITEKHDVPERIACIWICCAWLGLLVLSLLALPMTVTRYALPAGIPALLLPLLLAARLHRHAPILLAMIIAGCTAPQWIRKVTTTEPGFREMVAHIRDHADPQTDGVALVIEPSEAPYWAEMRRLALQYYPLVEYNVIEVEFDHTGEVTSHPILQDGRRWYLMVFRSDPVPAVLAAGRRFDSFAGTNTTYRQLPFEPYRLLKVAPIDQEDPE